MGPRLQARISQGLVADDSDRWRHDRSDGVHDAVRLFRPEIRVPLQPMGDGYCWCHHRLRAELLRLPSASILHRSASTGRTINVCDFLFVS